MPLRKQRQPFWSTATSGNGMTRAAHANGSFGFCVCVWPPFSRRCLTGVVAPARKQMSEAHPVAPRRTTPLVAAKASTLFALQAATKKLSLARSCEDSTAVRRERAMELPLAEVLPRTAHAYPRSGQRVSASSRVLQQSNRFAQPGHPEFHGGPVEQTVRAILGFFV